jgi:UDP-N-acetylmuramate--alanine ligase
VTRDAKRIHLIGISGSGVKGLARFYRARGYAVSGSDHRPGPDREALVEAGITVHDRHDARHVPLDADRVIISRAIPPDNPERRAAENHGIPVETYSRALGRILGEHAGTGIGVAGTHGKTTTSAWLARMLEVAGRDPSFIIGGDVEDFEGNMRVGSGPEFIVEACEYGGSFHDIRPTLGVILNVEDDHQECYGGPEGVRKAFGRFARTIPPGGTLVIHRALLSAVRDWGVTARVVPVDPDGIGVPRRLSDHAYSLAPADPRTANGELVLMRGGRGVTRLRPALPGRYSAANMLFAAAVACEVGADVEAIRRAAGCFRGVKRRFENLGTHRGVTVIDDYAHHPTEVHAVLTTARRVFDGRRLTVVFEPHQFRRLKEYMTDFARELAVADRVVITDVFAARERPEDWRAIRPEDLVSRIRNGSDDERARFVPLDGVVGQVCSRIEAGDVVMALGAGRSSEVAHGLVDALQ